MPRGPAVPIAGIAQLLHAAGISPDVANDLAATYPDAHILEKLDLVQWLEEHHPKLVQANPAGFLRRAIERDYMPPQDYLTPAQREAAAQARAETASAEERRLRAAEDEYRQEKKRVEQQLAERCPPQPVAGTDLTTQALWAAVLAELQEHVTGPNYHMWLKPAVLVSCDDQRAVVAAPSKYHAEHLAERLDRTICQTMSAVLGRRVQCAYVTLDELVTDEAPNPTGEGSTRQGHRAQGGPYAAG